jgi:anti-sigma factor RsiW
MRNMQHCDRVLVAAAFALLLSTSLPASSVAAEVAADAKVETAGERAHFAQPSASTGTSSSLKRRCTTPPASTGTGRWDGAVRKAASAR